MCHLQCMSNLLPPRDEGCKEALRFFNQLCLAEFAIFRDGVMAVEPKDVLLLWPNVICYVRAALGAFALGLAWWPDPPLTNATVILYVCAMTLDFLDGYVARRLHQQTLFGAALDVVVDVAQRGGMWLLALNLPGLLFPLLELIVFACTHACSSESWKEGCFSEAPPLIARIMSNGFKTPMGVLTVAGLHFLPLYLWLIRVVSALRFPAFYFLGILLCLGRLLGLAAEVWVVKRHVAELLRQDAAALTSRQH
eukprot:symbB.v1.2.011363.t1/scaffold741.1/size166877/7